MKIPLTALALLALACGARANDDSGSSANPLIVQSPHGGYNTIQNGQLPATRSIFGSHDNNSSNTFIVASPHGGYNTIQSTKPPATTAFFGFNGAAAHIIKVSHEPKKFILVPFVKDMNGAKVTVYKRVYYPTAEDAEAAQALQ